MGEPPNLVSVSVVEDEVDFADLLCNFVFIPANGFTLKTCVRSASEFFRLCPTEPESAQQFMPRLLVADVFAYTYDKNSKLPQLDGIHMVSGLYRVGLKFDALFISSMDISALMGKLSNGNQGSVSFLAKTPRLSVEEILSAARSVLRVSP